MRLTIRLLALIVVLVAGPVRAADSSAYILVDVRSGAVLDSRLSDRLWQPASLTKLMTAYKTFYDPGLRHADQLPVRFELKYYESAQYPWPKCDPNRDGVRGNYMYYPQSDQAAKANPPAGQELWSLEAQKTSQLVSQRTLTTDLIYTVNTRPHTTSKNPNGINALWGDIHVSYSTTKAAFDPSLWDPGDNDATSQDPGDNTPRFRTIVSLLRP